MNLTKTTLVVATGAVLIPVVGLTAGILVAPTMSMYGTVIAGVDDIAAILQSTSTLLVSTTGSTIGGITGGF